MCLSLRRGTLFLLLSQCLSVSGRHRGQGSHFQLQFCHGRRGLGPWEPWSCLVGGMGIMCYIKPLGMWERDGDHQMQTGDSSTPGYGGTELQELNARIEPLPFLSSLMRKFQSLRSVLQKLNNRIFFLKDPMAQSENH